MKKICQTSVNIVLLILEHLYFAEVLYTVFLKAKQKLQKSLFLLDQRGGRVSKKRVEIEIHQICTF